MQKFNSFAPEAGFQAAWNPQPFFTTSAVICSTKCLPSTGGCGKFIYKQAERECYVENDAFPESEIDHPLVYRLGTNDVTVGESCKTASVIHFCFLSDTFQKSLFSQRVSIG